jgi:hypothetical protein
MNNKNIISNKFDLNWSTTFSYKIIFCQKSLQNSGAHYTGMCIILDKIRYITFFFVVDGGKIKLECGRDKKIFRLVDKGNFPHCYKTLYDHNL